MVLNHAHFCDLHSEKIPMTKLVWHHFIWLPHFVNLRHLYCNLNFILNFFSFVIHLIPTVSMIGRWNFEVSLLQFVGIVNTHSKHQLVSFSQMVGIFNTYNLWPQSYKSLPSNDTFCKYWVHETENLQKYTVSITDCLQNAYI